MRSRAPALAAVVVFAVAVALVAALAGQGGDERLVKLPAASLGGGAADQAAPAAEATSTRSAAPYGGAIEYEIRGTLPELPSEAPGYRLGSGSTEGAVARLAASLGLAGDVQAVEDGWVLRSGDVELRVAHAPGLPWFVAPACPDAPVTSDKGVESTCAIGVAVDGPAAVDEVRKATETSMAAVAEGSTGSAGGCTPEQCGVATVVPAPPAACDGGTEPCATTPAVEPCAEGEGCIEPAPAPVCSAADVKCAEVCAPDQRCPLGVPEPVEPPVRPVELPSQEDARTAAGEIFARLGVGTRGMVVDDGWTSWMVRVPSEIDGLPVVGMDTSLSIGPELELVGGNGFLAVPERIGDYPLVSPEAALERYTDGFAASAGVARDLPLPAVAEDGGASTAPACGDPAVSCIAEPVPFIPSVQTVTGAHLALLYTGDALVPAYVFDILGGGTMPVPAVTDEWLDEGSTVLGR